MYDKNDFSVRFDALLKKRGVTQKDLSALLSIRRENLSEWKRLGTIPSTDTALAVAQYLNVSVEYLLTGTDTYKEAFTQSDREHLAKWQKLTDTEQSVVSTTIDAMIATHSPADALNIDYERAQKNSPCALPKTLAKLVQERMVGWVIVRYGGFVFWGVILWLGE